LFDKSVKYVKEVKNHWPIHSHAEVTIAIRYKPQAVRCNVLGQGVQPCCTGGPNAHNQIGQRPTAACVKFNGLDNALATHGRLAKLNAGLTIRLLRLLPWAVETFCLQFLYYCYYHKHNYRIISLNLANLTKYLISLGLQ